MKQAEINMYAYENDGQWRVRAMACKVSNFKIGTEVS